MPRKSAADRRRDELEELTVGDLRDRARAAGVEGISRKRKGDLVDALVEAGGRRSGGAKQAAATEQPAKKAPATKKATATKEQPATKSTAAKRSTAKKSTATKEQPAAKASAKKSTAKKSSAKKSSAKKSSATGSTQTTKEHDVIQRWAEERDATPATVPGTEHGDHLGVLRFDFPGYGGDDLEHVEWDEWFDTFDVRDLEFKYQDTLASGKQSNFFILTNPDREDA